MPLGAAAPEVSAAPPAIDPFILSYPFDRSVVVSVHRGGAGPPSSVGRTRRR